MAGGTFSNLSRMANRDIMWKTYMVTVRVDCMGTKLWMGSNGMCSFVGGVGKPSQSMICMDGDVWRTLVGGFTYIHNSPKCLPPYVRGTMTNMLAT